MGTEEQNVEKKAAAERTEARRKIEESKTKHHAKTPAAGSNVRVHYMVGGPNYRSTVGEVVATEPKISEKDRAAGVPEPEPGMLTVVADFGSGQREMDVRPAPSHGSPSDWPGHAFPCWSPILPG